MGTCVLAEYGYRRLRGQTNTVGDLSACVTGLLLAMTRQVFFLIPLLLLLPLKFGIDGVMLAGPIADFIAFIVSVVCVRKELKRQALQVTGMCS